ncbi:MAG: potassium channel family protein [Thermoleophilia bacterium]
MSSKDPTLVIGLGRFGRALAETLADLGHDVLGVDTSPRIVQSCSLTLTHVVQADATDAEALRQLGATDFPRAVVAIGTDVQASILATYALVDLAIPRIWAKAITVEHGAILQRVGAHKVVFPERDMGTRVARTMVGRTIDYLEIAENFVLIETTVPREIAGLTLDQARVRSRYNITIVSIRRPGEAFTYATQETRLHAGDIVVIAGEPRAAEAFAALD